MGVLTVDRGTSTGAADAVSFIGDDTPSSAASNYMLATQHGTIDASVTESDRGYLASDDLFSQWGVGSTPDKAMFDLFESILAYYDDLADHRDRLSPRLSGQLRALELFLGR